MVDPVLPSLLGRAFTVREMGVVAHPSECLVAAGPQLGLADAVAAGDWLVRRRRTTPEQLISFASQASGRGSRIARTAASFVRAGAESPRESRLRLCLVMAGLLEPACNVEVGDDNRWIARVDLALLAYRVLLECEGDHHRTDRRRWDHDVRRYEDLTAAGFVVIRVTARCFRDPREVVTATYAHLVENGYAGSPPTPPPGAPCSRPSARKPGS